MDLITKASFAVFALIVLFGQSEASVANLLADRTLSKISQWIQIDGSVWMTIPGHFQRGLIHNVNNRFTLAFSGPRLTAIGELTRSGEATLDDAEYDPLYSTSQKLHFTGTLKNITVNYTNVAYTEDDLGSFNFTPIASISSVTVEIEIDLKGDLKTCVGFPGAVTVNSNNGMSVTLGNKTTDESVPAVIDAVTSHFKKNVVAHLKTLLESGIFNSLENYDVCQDAYNPLPPANMLAEHILLNVAKSLTNNVSTSAWLPGFWKQFHAPNGSVTSFLRADVGHFVGAGNVRRVGNAEYSQEDSQHSIGMKFETDSITAFYPSIYFTHHTTEYNLSEIINAQKLAFSLSVPFFKSPYSSVPICNHDNLQLEVTYSGGQLQTQLTPSLPDDLAMLVNSTMTYGFLGNLKEAATDLFRTTAIKALMTACPKSTSDAKYLLPPADDMADRILNELDKVSVEHAGDWTHLPGSWKHYFAVNGTLIYFVSAGFGNITHSGHIQKTSAAYSGDMSSLNIVFKTSSLSAIYGQVVYSSNWVRYNMAETVASNTLTTILTLTFKQPQGSSGAPRCLGGGVSAIVYYDGEDAQLKNFNPEVPADVQAIIAAQLSASFVNDIKSSISELYTNIAMNILEEICDETPS